MPESVPVDLPLPGICIVKRPPGHHPYALDLMGLDTPTGSTRTTGGIGWLAGMTQTADYHGWGRPVYAPGAGVVVAAVDTQLDHRRTGAIATCAIWLNATVILPRRAVRQDHVDITSNVGNHVMIHTGSNQIVFYAHLQHHSVRVAVGSHLSPGDPVGLVGNSGNSTAPHLHIHVLDQADDLATAQLRPFHFTRYQRWTGTTWTHHTDTLPTPGQVIRPADGD